MQSGTSQGQQLTDRRENFRRQIRKQHWAKRIEEQRKASLELSELQTLAEQLREFPGVQGVALKVKEATLPVVERLQDELTAEIMGRLRELHSEDLIVLGEVQKRTHRLSTAVLD